MPIRLRAIEAPIAKPAPTFLPAPIATDAPTIVAEIWGLKTEKRPLESFEMMTDVPDERSVTDHSSPVSSLGSIRFVPVSTLRMVTDRSLGSFDNSISAAARIAWSDPLNMLSLVTSVGSGVPASYKVPLMVVSDSNRSVCPASSSPTARSFGAVRGFVPAAELALAVMVTGPLATSLLFSTRAFVRVLITFVESAPAPLSDTPISFEKPAAREAATATE